MGKAVLFGACRPNVFPVNKTSLSYPACLLCYPSLLQSAPTGLSIVGRCGARINDNPPRICTIRMPSLLAKFGHAAVRVVLYGCSGVQCQSVLVQVFRGFTESFQEPLRQYCVVKKPSNCRYSEWATGWTIRVRIPAGTTFFSATKRPGRSQWPRGLRRRSAAARMLRLWVRIPPGAWMFVL